MHGAVERMRQSSQGKIVYARSYFGATSSPKFCWTSCFAGIHEQAEARGRLLARDSFWLYWGQPKVAWIFHYIDFGRFIEVGIIYIYILYIYEHEPCKFTEIDMFVFAGPANCGILSSLHCQPRRTASRICRDCSIGLVANVKPGKHLAYGHPSMERVRQWVKFQVDSGKVSPYLCCNFDQVWSMNWRPRRRVLQTKKEGYGNELAKHPSLKKVRHGFERLLNLPFSELLGGEEVVDMDEPGVSGGVAANVAVESFRLPHTLTTLSWSTGELGRGFVTARADHLPEKTRLALNKDFWHVASCMYIYIYI